MRGFYLWLALTSACLAQEGPLSTDAPTFSRTSHTVGEGVTQWETGLVYSSFRSSPDLVSLPGTLRHGVTPDLEVRLETNGLSFQGRDYGYTDLGVGFKYEFASDWALVGLLTAPTGHGVFRGPGYVPFVSVNHDVPLGEADNLLFNAGASLLPAGQGVQALGTCCYSHTFSPELGCFLEAAVLGNQVVADTGLQIYPNPDWVLNLQVLRGLSGNQGWGGQVGFGVRFR